MVIRRDHPARRERGTPLHARPRIDAFGEERERVGVACRADAQQSLLRREIVFESLYDRVLHQHTRLGDRLEGRPPPPTRSRGRVHEWNASIGARAGRW
jgi:hypothetical protein